MILMIILSVLYLIMAALMGYFVFTRKVSKRWIAVPVFIILVIALAIYKNNPGVFGILGFLGIIPIIRLVLRRS